MLQHVDFLLRGLQLTYLCPLSLLCYRCSAFPLSTRFAFSHGCFIRILLRLSLTIIDPVPGDILFSSSAQRELDDECLSKNARA